MSVARSFKSVLFSTAASLERIVKPSRADADPSRNFLLLQHPTALGTAVHATPLVAALRQSLPSSRIGVIASGLALQVFRNNPHIDHLVETPSPLRDLRAAASSLRTQNPFAGQPFSVLTTCGNERTLVALQSLFTGVTARIGFTEVPELYRTILTFDPGRSLIDNNLRIVEELAGPVEHIEPQMFPTEEDRAWAQRTLAEAGAQPGQMVAVFVTQTSITQRKSWRAERFAAVARYLIERHNAHILFVGTAAESAAIDSLRATIPYSGATSTVAGKTTLPQLAALLSRCRIGLTLDTGTLHVGRTVNLPMVVIAPAWSPVLEWLPVNNPRYRILKNADLPTCPPEYIIDEVSVDEVVGALEGLLEQYPA